MSLGGIYTTSTQDSAAKKNLFGVVSGTGAYLASLDKSKITLAFCTSTGSGLTVDHIYVVSADNTTFIDLRTLASHNHSGSTSGGVYEDIKINSPDILDLMLTKTTDLYEASWASPVYWIKAVTSTGSVENKTDGTTGERSIRLRPNGTSGSGATISYPHHRLSFAVNALYQCKLQIETATSIALHSGINADDVTAADSNTRKLQAEVCTTTNNNWWLRTADGTTHTASDTGIAISANRVAIKIVHKPTLGTPESDLYIDAGTVLQKTSNIPTSGNTAENNLVKQSVKNSTAADRPLLFYGCRLAYGVLSTDMV